MEIRYEDLIIKKKILLRSGMFCMTDSEFVVITGENGSGKSLLMRNIFLQLSSHGYRSIMIDQSSEHIIKNRTILEKYYIK